MLEYRGFKKKNYFFVTSGAYLHFLNDAVNSLVKNAYKVNAFQMRVEKTQRQDSLKPKLNLSIFVCCFIQDCILNKQLK